LIPSIQVALFWHVFETQSSILFSHVGPSYPAIQLHVKAINH